MSRRRVPLVYTPHCYAFERQDVGAAVRAAFRAAEGLLAINTTVFAACSEREKQLSAWPTRHAPRILVPNVAPEQHAGPRTPAEVPLVVGGGRLSPQKDPAFFLACVERIRAQRPEARALWLGDDDVTVGTVRWRDRLEAGGVEVSGWLPRAATLDLLGGASLYLHSARWEGFPLMVAEAAALGVPTLVRALPSFAGVPPELMLGSPDDVSPALACLDGHDAARANVAGWAQVLAHHTVVDQHAALVDVYARATARTSPHQ